MSDLSNNLSYKREFSDMKQKAKGTFTVLNDKGLHTRPSTELVKCAAHFGAQIELSYRDYVVNAKSILGILMLAAEKGAKISIEAVGEDAELALAAILQLAQNKFNIKY
jgi:phosphocarrier protein